MSGEISDAGDYSRTPFAAPDMRLLVREPLRATRQPLKKIAINSSPRCLLWRGESISKKRV